MYSKWQTVLYICSRWQLVNILVSIICIRMGLISLFDKYFVIMVMIANLRNLDDPCFVITNIISKLPYQLKDSNDWPCNRNWTADNKHVRGTPGRISIEKYCNFILGTSRYSTLSGFTHHIMNHVIKMVFVCYREDSMPFQNEQNANMIAQYTIWSQRITSLGLLRCRTPQNTSHYGDVTMGAIASQITSLAIVYWTVYSDADQRKYHSSP